MFYSHYAENTSKDLSRLQLKFPCFDDSQIWFKFEEQDRSDNDKAEVEMDCKTLQIGSNTLAVELEEDTTLTTVTIDAVSTVKGWFFDFSVDESESKAKY